MQKCGDGSYGPAVNAEIARAKLGGLMVDRKEVRLVRLTLRKSEIDGRE